MKVTNNFHGKIGKVINADQVTIHEREEQPEERAGESAEERAEERAEEEEGMQRPHLGLPLEGRGKATGRRPKAGNVAAAGEESFEEVNETVSLVMTSVEWRALQEHGWMDAEGQPTVTRTEAAVMASVVAQRLGIENKWKVFEELWDRTNMSRDMQRAMGQRKTLDFMDELKKCLASPNIARSDL